MKMQQPPNPAWNFYPDTVSRWAWIDAFTPDECSRIIHYASCYDLKDGTLAKENQDLSVRKSKVVFLFPGPETRWFYQKLTDAVLWANKEYFNFELNGFNEALQFTEYNAPDSHYDFHVDKTYGGMVRKLSIVLQLTDPNTYEGGNFEFNDHKPEVLPREQGKLLLFPSYTLHRVTPVTSGTRHSLVGWIGGPQFK